MKTPEVSVVVSSRNRLDSLRVLVKSLEEQRLDPDRFEVVVVDNGYSTPLEAEDLVGPTTPVDLRVIRNPDPRGASSGRNVGWQAARGALVAFTDDDCRTDPDWLKALLEESTDDRIIQGKTQPDPLHPAVGDFDHTNIVRGPNQLFETCNVAYPRRLLEEVGGFDETYLYAGEDVDLGWRVQEAGGRLVFASGAIVYHAVVPMPLRAQLRRTTHWIDAVKVLRAHPHLRSHLHRGVFWKKSHPWVLTAIGGVVAAAAVGKPWLVPLGAAPWLVHYMRYYAGKPRGIRRLVRNLPRHAAVDIVEVATMVAGSLRYRTLML